MLGRQPLRVPGEPVVRTRDLLGLISGDTGNGSHANIVCGERLPFVNMDWLGDRWRLSVVEVMKTAL
jgi:hypothetical protein